MITTPIVHSIVTIIRKDLRAEFRTRELVTSMALFTLLSVLIFSFALQLDREARRELISGVLWVTLVFASVLGLNRSLVNEREQGSMDAMLLAPIDRTSIYIGKTVGNFLFTLLVGLILLPLITILYNVPLIRPMMVVNLVLGVLGLASVGTLLATMTAQTRSRETLLPIVLLPVTLPILLTVLQAGVRIMEGDIGGSWLLTLMAIDGMYLIIGTLLFEFVVED